MGPRTPLEEAVPHALAAREILPSHLHIQRSEWRTHAHYPRQTLLLRSHDGFRSTSQALMEACLRGVQAARIRAYFGAWKGAMHSHEGYEEHKLYPFLEARWGVSMDLARQGHEALSSCEDAVFSAEEGSLLEALREHDRVLGDHLELEEDLVIPALLQLEPEEFDALTRFDIGTLLARFKRNGPPV
jgi:hemerythrin superfamily protein